MGRASCLPAQRRGQVSSEYMLSLVAVMVVVALVMAMGLQNIEMDVALSAVRLGGADFVSSRPYAALGSMNYTVDEGAGTANISPQYTYYNATIEAGEAELAANYSLAKLAAVFSPNAAGIPANGCLKASYRTYCVLPVVTRPS